MLRIYRLNDKGIVDITKYCESATFKGGLSDVSRSFDMSFFYSLYDNKYGKPQLNCGDKIKCTWNNADIFQGVVVDRSINSDQSITITTFDYAFYLKQSKVTYNFSNITAEQATGIILKDLGIQVGYLEKTNVRISRLIKQKTAYDAIMELYSQVSKQNNKKYFLEVKQGKCNVMLLGHHTVSKEIRLADYNNTKNLGNLLSLEYSDTMGNMINRVKVYDSNNKYKTTVENKTEVKKFGILQDNYVIEEGKNYNTVAKNMLHGIDTEVTVTINGDIGFQSGRAINIRVPVIDVLANRHMYIVNDSHDFNMNTGEITTNLTLSFNNEMDFKEGDDE